MTIHGLFILLLAAGTFLAGCTTNPNEAIRTMRLEQKSVFGEPRLFSTVGFWVLDDPVKQKVLSSYTPSGALDRAALRTNLPEATFSEEPGHVLVTMGTGTAPVFVLGDGPLIALDATSDEMIKRLAQDYAHDGKHVPVVTK